MKWQSHKVLTFSIVGFITGSAITAFLSALGSVIPDAIEGHGYKECNTDRYWRWKKRHRTMSHWWFIYAITLFGGLFALRCGDTGYKVLGYVVFCFSVGGLCHIAQDALSGKVPFLRPFKKNFGIRLVKTGSVVEIIAVTLMSGILLYYAKDKLINSIFSLIIEKK
ncbi:MAG: metal-dependent hydrolase [Candidatus Methanomethylicaceae archaeon]